MQLGSGSLGTVYDFWNADCGRKTHASAARTPQDWRNGIALAGVSAGSPDFGGEVDFVSFEVSRQTELKNAEWHFSATCHTFDTLNPVRAKKTPPAAPCANRGL
ncbi:hypothetical protein [Cupriavidus necator]|uniref:hypothetical protein n=1 Tax=Cupriavidus necator TaxID=106590 RepID=UPI0012D2D3AF|nr:hypothetical protein [Cupriavidus necator]